MEADVGLLYRMVRTALFQIDPEEAHDLVLDLAEGINARRWMGNFLQWWYRPSLPSLRVQCLGIEHASPIGLAAGFDPDARATTLLASLGFGHVEVGTVMTSPFAGSPRPRLFRVRSEPGLLHHRGRPSRGAIEVAHSLGAQFPGVPVSVNLGRPGLLPGESLDHFLEEIAEAAYILAPTASFLTLNTQLPGAEPGKLLEDPEIATLQIHLLRERLPHPHPPILLKLSPDLEETRTAYLAEAALEAGAAGFICGGAAERQVDLPALTRTRIGPLKGLYAGPALLQSTAHRLRFLRRSFGPRPVLIGSGGIYEGKDALLLLRAGADLLQIFTALVYRGPSAPGQIGRELAEEMHRLGARSLSSVRNMDL